MRKTLAVMAAIASVAIAGLLLAGCAATEIVAIYMPGGDPPLSEFFAIVAILASLWTAPVGVALGIWGAVEIPRQRRTVFRFAVAGLAGNAALFLWAAYLFFLG